MVIFAQQQLQRDRNNKRPERKCVICNGPHWASQCAEKQGKPGEIQRILYDSSHRNEHVRKEALETGKAFIDCGATKSMGSWEALDGLARMIEQRHGQLDFLGSHEENMERRVAFKVDAGGRTGEGKINCLYNVLSVHSLSQMGAISDFSTGAAFFRHLADQAFVQLERESYGHRYLSLSQPTVNKEQLQGFQAAAQVLENLDKDVKSEVVLQHPLFIISCMTVTSTSTTNKFQQIHHRQEPPHQIPTHDSTWVQCSITQQFSHL